MKKIKYKLEIGYATCDDEGIKEVPDDMTSEEIDAMVQDMAEDWAATWEGDTRLCWEDEMDPEDYDEATQSFYENICGSWEFTEDDYV